MTADAEGEESLGGGSDRDREAQDDSEYEDSFICDDEDASGSGGSVLYGSLEDSL
jgi:hypothetical protein